MCQICKNDFKMDGLTQCGDDFLESYTHENLM